MTTRLYTVLKRYLDFEVSVAALTLLLPLLVMIALAVRLDSPGPVFYAASRVGRNGKLFKMYKFRSMVAHADKIGPGVTGAADKRITRVGRILRRTKLDELPQLINVLIGDMSLVGPRPEDPRYVQHYTAEQRTLLQLRPGITSQATLQYRNEEAELTGENPEAHYIAHVMPAKLTHDLNYFSRASVVGDVVILLRTLEKVVRS
jgi:lipopolysaccharide/colanic/teichoic acid biosynthesis glycosyltransferase